MFVEDEEELLVFAPAAAVAALTRAFFEEAGGGCEPSLGCGDAETPRGLISCFGCFRGAAEAAVFATAAAGQKRASAS